MKKFLILSLCAIVLLGLLAGCTTKTPSTDENTPNSGQSAPNNDNNFDSGTNPNNPDNNNNNNNNNDTSRLEELTDAEKATLREQINAIDGLTYSDIAFDGTSARLTVESELAEFGDDIKNGVLNVLRALRPNVTTVEIVK